MKTVGEFKKAGLVFVKGDTCKEQKGTTYVAGGWSEYENQGDGDWIDDVVIEFAWRENTGVKPEFSGAIDAIIRVGDNVEQLNSVISVNIFSWSLVIKWRPSLNQPSVAEYDAKQAAIHKAWVDLKGDLSNARQYDENGSYLAVCIKDGFFTKEGGYGLSDNLVENTEYWKDVCTVSEFTDYCEKMAAEEKRMDIIGQNGNDGLHYDNTAQQVEALALDDKPIFTQAMADAGELPPVGSLFIDIEYNENKQVLALAHHLGKVVYASDYDDVSQVEYFHADQDCCRPLGTRTDREKAIDEMLKDSRCNGSVIEICIERLYDAGYRKC